MSIDMQFNSKFGYEYFTKGDVECLENIILLYDKDDSELYWISCSNRNFATLERFFETEVIVIFGFYLKSKSNVDLTFGSEHRSVSIKQTFSKFVEFTTAIHYGDILDDMKANDVLSRLKLGFEKDTWERMRRFRIEGNTFQEMVDKLIEKLLQNLPVAER